MAVRDDAVDLQLLHPGQPRDHRASHHAGRAMPWPERRIWWQWSLKPTSGRTCSGLSTAIVRGFGFSPPLVGGLDTSVPHARPRAAESAPVSVLPCLWLLPSVSTSAMCGSAHTQQLHSFAPWCGSCPCPRLHGPYSSKGAVHISASTGLHPPRAPVHTEPDAPDASDASPLYPHTG